MRTPRRGSAFVPFLVVLLVLGFLAACSSAPKQPTELEQARKLLDEAWGMGGNGQVLVVSLLYDYPDLAYAKEKVVEAARSPSLSLKVEGARVLARWADPGTKDLLLELLKDDNDVVRLIAARTLARLGDASGKEILEGAIRDADGALEPDVCAALHAIGEDTCLAPAIKDLVAKDDAKSAAAAAVLGEIGTDKARNALRRKLMNLYKQRRNPAIAALAEIGNPKDVAAVVPFANYKDNLLAVIDALGTFGGDQAVQHLRGWLAQKKDPVVRVAAACALVQAGVVDDDVVAALEEGASSDNKAVRAKVARGLRGSRADGKVAAVLAKLCEDPEPSIRRDALLALEGRVDASVLPALRKAWEMGRESNQEGPEYESALLALRLAAKVPGDEALALLEEGLASQNWAHNIEAALGILWRAEHGMLGRQQDAS